MTFVNWEKLIFWDGHTFVRKDRHMQRWTNRRVRRNSDLDVSMHTPVMMTNIECAILCGVDKVM